MVVQAQLWEDGDFLCGGDDFQFAMGHVIDVATGQVIGGETVHNGDVAQVAPGATCAERGGGGGWGYCWDPLIRTIPVERIAFAPICWQAFDQGAFDAAVERWPSFFTSHSAFDNCDEDSDPFGRKIDFVKLPHSCPASLTPTGVLAELPLPGSDIIADDIDVIAAVADGGDPNIGGTATLLSGLLTVRTGGFTPWADGEYLTFAHEYGHAALGLGEEYRQASSSEVALWPNEVTLDLQGCDPTTCCNLPHPNPSFNGIICPGNLALNLLGWNWGDALPGLSGGRCIMSNMSAGGWDSGNPVTGAGSARGWCPACWATWGTAGDQCSQVFAGTRRLFGAGGRMNPDATIVLDFANIGEGRTGPEPPTAGDKLITLEDLNGNLLGQAAIHTLHVDPNDAGGTIDSFWVRFPVDEEVELPLRLKATGDGNLATQVTVGGTTPTAVLNDVIVECQGGEAAIVGLDAGGSFDPDGDTIYYQWTAPVPLAGGAEVSGLFPLGDSEVSVAVRDAMAEGSSAIATVSVVDTTAPTITLGEQGHLSVCSITGETVVLQSPEVIDRCGTLVTIEGAIVASTNPEVMVPVPVLADAVTLPAGEHVVEWTATDGSGNESHAQQTVVILPAVLTTERLKLQDGARLLANGLPSGGANLGDGLTVLGNDAESGDIWSVGPVELRDRVFVSGDVLSQAAITEFNQVVVTGVIGPFEELVLPTVSIPVVEYPTPVGSVLLEPGEVDELSPASYSSIHTKTGATLSLTPGTYYVHSLALEPNSTITAPDRVTLYIRDQFTYRGALAGFEQNGSSISYTGANPVYLEAPLATDLRAYHASLVVRGDFTGRIAAREIIIDPDRSIHCE